jgi:hypothetical protein
MTAAVASRLLATIVMPVQAGTQDAGERSRGWCRPLHHLARYQRMSKGVSEIFVSAGAGAPPSGVP